jgi:hypothetical protein
VDQARKEGLPLEPFTVHDLRRTGSTLLNELGFNSDWIEKCLAHKDDRSSRGVYNKAEDEIQRRHTISRTMQNLCIRVATSTGGLSLTTEPRGQNEAVLQFNSRDQSCRSYVDVVAKSD